MYYLDTQNKGITLSAQVQTIIRKYTSNVCTGFVFFALVWFLPIVVAAQSKSIEDASPSVCEYIVNHANKGELGNILIAPSSVSTGDKNLPEEIAEAAESGNAVAYIIDINNDGKLEKVYISYEGTLDVYPLNDNRQGIPILFSNERDITAYDEEPGFQQKVGIIQYQGKAYLLVWRDNSLDTLLFIDSSNMGAPICWFGQRNQPESKQEVGNGKTCQINYVLSPIEILKEMANDSDIWEYAISQPGIGAVDILIRSGEDINGRPLMIAIKNKRIDIVEMLLKAGGDPNKEVKDYDVASSWPLEFAVNEDALEVAQLLLKYGAGKNERACSNAFMWANGKDSMEMLDLLLDNGIPIPDDRVAEAVRNGHHKALKRLFARGLIDLNRKYTEEWAFDIREEAPGVLSVNSKAKPVRVSKTLMEWAAVTFDIETLLTLKEETAKQGNNNLPCDLSTSSKEAYVMPDELIDGLSQAEWGWRYWEWSRSFPQGQAPADDKTGNVCMQKQSGSVIMLTGSNQSNPIKRSGEVPSGKYFFIPVLASLAEQTGEYNCERNMSTVLSNNVTSLFVQIDGKSIADMNPFKQTSGCYFIDTYAGEKFAAFDGYWLMLRPLAPGKHIVRFGGSFSDGFSQDIIYELSIK